MRDIKCMLVVVVPRWQRSQLRDAEGWGSGEGVAKGVGGSCIRKKTPFYAPLPPHPPKRKKENQFRKRRKRKLGGGCRTEKEIRSDFTFLSPSPVEGRGKNTDPRDPAVQLGLSPGLSLGKRGQTE